MLKSSKEKKKGGGGRESTNLLWTLKLERFLFFSFETFMKHWVAVFLGGVFSQRVSSVTSVKPQLQLLNSTRTSLLINSGYFCGFVLIQAYQMCSCFWETLYSEPKQRAEQNFSKLVSRLKREMVFTRILLLLFLPLLGIGKYELLE